MSDINTQLNTINTALNNIKEAIIDKGQTPSGNITTYADAISNIETGITPTGSIDITQNGTYDVTEKAQAVVNVSVQPEPFVYTVPPAILNTSGYAYYMPLMSSPCFYQDILSSMNQPFVVDCSGVKAIEITNPALTIGYSTNVCPVPNFFAAFRNPNVISIDFSSLNHLPTKIQNMADGVAPFMSIINGTNNVDIYFRALTQSSVESTVGNIFHNLCYRATNCRIHFPSNIENAISQLAEYPLFGGESGEVTILFDLPATS